VFRTLIHFGPNWPEVLFYSKGGTEQLEAIKKPNLFKLPLSRLGGGRFVFTLAALLFGQKRNRHGSAGSGGHSELTEQHLVSVEVGSYGLPEGVLNDKTQLIGKVAQTDIAKGDYLFSQKVGDYLSNELLDRIVKNNQRLVTVSVPSVAAGLSSHLLAGDIVTVAVFMERASNGQDSSPQVILYPELKGLEVYSVENARTQDTAEMREQQKESQSGSSDPVPKTVTLIVTESQAEKLIEAEYTGKLHLIFEKRGVSVHEQ
jgi:pilus assembly protein CpaB